MKQLSNYKYLIIIAALFLAAVSGCKKDNKQPTGTLKLHLHTYINGEEVDSLGKLYPDANGRLMSLNLAQFYMSKISVKDASGNWHTIPNTILLKRIEREDYYAGEVPIGDYTNIRFDVGLDSITNKTEPSQHSTTGADSVLSTKEIFMWNGWTWAGYTFMYIIGTIDTSVAHDGVSQGRIFYQLMDNANLRTVTLGEQAFTIKDGQAYEIHIGCDYGKLLQNLDMTDRTNRFTDGQTYNIPTGTNLANTIPSIFYYE